ncbi:MAG: SPOC like C-terminal domain-containing protein [Piptocephalis tieghemiana]|nr:MAG: SPOC like C-terminal domain-containing protein [Piptocephalis tieghemiana]
MTDADFPRVVEATKYSNAVAFLIDASCSMLQETVMVPQGQEMQETSSLQLAVDAIMAVARDQACSSEAQALGVLLYNTKYCRNEFDLPYIYQLIPLRQCTLSTLARLSTLLKANSSYFEQVGSCQVGERPSALADVLWLAKRLFQERCTGSRRIILITDQKIPHPLESDLHKQVRTRVREVTGSRVFISMHVLWSKEEEKMDEEEKEGKEDETEESIGRNLYHFMVGEKSPRIPGSRVSVAVHGQGARALEGMAEYIRERQRSPMVAVHYLLHLSPSCTIAVAGYLEHRLTFLPKSQSMWLSPEGKERALAYPVKSRISLFATKRKLATSTNSGEGGEEGDEGMEEIPEEEITFYFRYKLSDGVVEMNQQERDRLKSHEPDGMILLGWMETRGIRPQNHISAPIFLRANDHRVAGSAEVMHMLVDTLLEMALVGLVRYPTSPHHTPRFGMLMPQKEGWSGMGEDARRDPCGLHLIPLPYMDEERPMTTLGKPTSFPPSSRDSSTVNHPDPLVRKEEREEEEGREGEGSKMSSRAEQTFVQSVIHRHTQPEGYDPTTEDMSDEGKAVRRLLDALIKKKINFTRGLEDGEEEGENTEEDDPMEPSMQEGQPDIIVLGDQEDEERVNFIERNGEDPSISLTSRTRRRWIYRVDEGDKGEGSG